MRFYLVEQKEAGESFGFLWFTRKDKAEEALRECRGDGEDDESTLVVVNIEPTKQGILQALKLYASHPDNG